MSRRIGWLFVAVLALAVAVPGIIEAAPGSFSSSTSKSALTAINSSTGRAINAGSNTGFAGVFARSATSGSTATLYATSKSNTNGTPTIYGNSLATGSGYTYGVLGRTGTSLGAGVFGLAAKTTGVNFGVFGRTDSTSDEASGVFGLAAAAGGLTNGVFGQANSNEGTGIFGFAPGEFGWGLYGIGGEVGVAGFAGPPGSGTFGVLSGGDMGIGGNVITTLGNVAGTCTILGAAASGPCTFTDPLPEGVTPIVVVTPAEDPGDQNRFWVSDQTTTGFVINKTSDLTGDLTFNYIVVGTIPETEAAFSSSRSR